MSDSSIVTTWEKTRKLLTELSTMSYGDRHMLHPVSLPNNLSKESVEALLKAAEELHARMFFYISMYAAVVQAGEQQLEGMRATTSPAPWNYANVARLEMEFLQVETRTSVITLFKYLEGDEANYPILMKHKDILLASVPARSDRDILCVIRILLESSSKDPGTDRFTQRCAFNLLNTKDKLNAVEGKYVRKMIKDAGFAIEFEHVVSAFKGTVAYE